MTHFGEKLKVGSKSRITARQVRSQFAATRQALLEPIRLL
jgi:hypothetical protein